MENNNNLSKDTLKIINILNKNPNIKKVKVDSILKNKFFFKLYNNIKFIINDIKIENINFKEIKNDINLYLKDNEFTSENIKNNIINNLKYSYEIKNDNNIIIYYTQKKINKKKINKINHMFMLIKLLKILFNRKEVEQKIIYFETEKKKKIPKEKIKIILGPNEINSGLTFLNLHKNGNIILYRKEEVLKVLIHELIHSNLIDEKIIFSNKIKEFSNIFCVNYEILLNEAFTETYATIINLFYIHIINKLPKNKLNIMFQNEVIYSNYICSKIIKYYEIKKIEDVIKKNEKCSNNFPQKTNVFAYYILKNILLSNHILFGNILNKNTVYYKINTEKGINDIIDIIIKNIIFLDNRIKYFKNDKNNSLRLCLYELK
jgi:hypothetical protein